MSQAEEQLSNNQRGLPEYPRCNKCLSKDVGRIPRSWLVKKLFPFWNIKHYQCYNCFNRFYRR